MRRRQIGSSRWPEVLVDLGADRLAFHSNFPFSDWLLASFRGVLCELSFERIGVDLRRSITFQINA